MVNGTTIALYGDSGSGKTTQAGEYAKYVKKSTGGNSVLFTSDLGGYDSIANLVKASIVRPVELEPKSDPWIYLDDAVNGSLLKEDDKLVIFDSGTSLGEALLHACSHSTFQIGQEKAQRFAVSQGSRSLSVSTNGKAHYGVVQGFLLDAIWKSTWLTRKGVNVLWTFSVDRGEEADRTPILGPKLAGHALTAAMPKWFKYTWKITSVPRPDSTPTHRLFLTEAPEMAGLGHSFSNSRYPLGATPLPAFIEPASIPEALRLIELGQKEADELLAKELNS